METTKKDILFQAAKAWKDLTQYRYIFTYGYKKKLYEITLCFTPSDFYHLAGFQYMKDISAPRFSNKKLLQKILDGTIDTAPFLHAVQFDKFVAPRLHAIIRLKDSLDKNFILFRYMARYYPFHTKINADYLISSHLDNTDFIFIINSERDSASVEYTCCSIFEQEERNYEEGQRELTLLKKERIYIPTNQSDILYDRLSTKSED